MVGEMDPQRWGDPALAAPLSGAVRTLVDAAFGAAESPVVAEPTLPASTIDAGLVASLARLVGADHVLTDTLSRQRRTRGKSTPDLLMARAGDLTAAPDLVVRPGSHEEVAAVLAWAAEHHIAVVPFGGGTSVTGGLIADRTGCAGVLSLDLGRMDRLLTIDHVSMTATFEPGIRGPEIERRLAAEGLTLGHFPQSFEYATIGGFAATRSSGQSSAGYGRFADMVVALRVATPIGELRTGSAPATAAGPDLRHVILGSEGTLGVITEITVRVRELPHEHRYEGRQFASFAAGTDAVRCLAQAEELPTVIRLSDEAETRMNLASQTAVGENGGLGCLMIIGHEGNSTAAVAARQEATAARLAASGGVPLGSGPGEAWVHGRFKAPYLRDSLLDVGVFVDTIETATYWSNVDRLRQAVGSAIEAELGRPTLVLCHISHVYATGCSLYFTVITKGGEDLLQRWSRAKAAASDAIIGAGATISHHHGVGTDHRPWLTREIGPVGVAMLRSLKTALDPTGILNPGVLIP